MAANYFHYRVTELEALVISCAYGSMDFPICDKPPIYLDFISFKAGVKGFMADVVFTSVPHVTAKATSSCNL